ncbi:DUF4351 domain-containing protein [Spirulina sp. CS-785/01]|uniref:DUF4351 domain-containing protein n=1 Tax=Spirulina sp. CS-785/01 TaxID=3021716 RepID=UPI00233015D4|nr:DUF4351 domain-containing protein [Spirulina sp. CS-785/01]MDB9312944.1 DUF4351 domain-containing protein [Spirulina sp. CS-785/01]
MSVLYQDVYGEGKQEEAVALVIRQLSRRFGELDMGLSERIRGLTVAQLEDLAEALLDFTTVAELQAWLRGVE